MDTFTGLVLKHRRIISLVWLAALLAGGFASSTLSSHLSQSFEIPGTRSDIADSAIVATYRSGGNDTAGHRRALAGRRYGGAAPTNGNPLQDPVIRPTTILGAMRGRLPAGTQVRVTGITPLTDTGGSGTGTSVRDEILIGALGALAVLAFVFASFLALVPLLIAAVSVTTAFLAILGLTYLIDISFIVQFLVGLIGLGVAIDYSLLLITRWREEIANGNDNAEGAGPQRRGPA